MVDWLYSVDAVNPPGALRDQMLDDPQRGAWFAEPFSQDDLGSAAGWLERNGLAKGTMKMDQREGPVRLHLTDAGVTCAEEFGSDTGRYFDKQRQPLPGAGSTINHITTHSGHVQVAGDHAQQIQTVTTSSSDLGKMIIEITQMVRALIPGVTDADRAQQTALDAVSARAVDQSAIRRFCDWAVSTAQTGATSASVAAISSATTTLLIEAGHLAAHLG